MLQYLDTHYSDESSVIGVAECICVVALWTPFELSPNCFIQITFAIHFIIAYNSNVLTNEFVLVRCNDLFSKLLLLPITQQ